MSLDNLVGISLDRVTPDAVAIGRLLAAARTGIINANPESLTGDDRAPIR